MTYLITVLRVELFKVWKSKVIWLTALAFTMAPLMAGFFMFVLKDPNLAESTGLLGAKAQIAGEASWPSYVKLHAQMISVGGILVFGFVMSWIFGREFADGTVKELLVLPYSRAIVIIAKFIVSLITNLLLTTYIIIIGFIIGMLIDLPNWSIDIIFDDYVRLIFITILTMILSTPVALFACVGRGYLAPLGFVIFTLVFSQVLTAIGYGHHFPWAIPAIYSDIIETDIVFSWHRLLLIFVTSGLGVISTIYYMLFTDQH